MAWQEGNLNRFQTSIQAMDAASQARKRGADTLTDRMKMLQQTGLQMGQWNQDKMRQYRDEWAKAYAKDPNIGTFQNWYKQVSGNQPLTEMFKGANLENALSGEGGNVVQKTSLPGAGYEGAFQKGIMETETDQRERAWENYKRTLEAEDKVKYDDLNPEQQRRIRLEFEKGYAPESWGGWGSTDKNQNQGILGKLRDAYMWYDAENMDETGVYKKEKPEKEKYINAIYAQIKDEPEFKALYKGEAAGKEAVRKFVEGVYTEGMQPVEDVAKQKDIPKPMRIYVPKITQVPTGKRQKEIYKEYENTKKFIDSAIEEVNKNPEKYSEDRTRIEALTNEIQEILNNFRFGFTLTPDKKIQELRTKMNRLNEISRELNTISMGTYQQYMERKENIINNVPEQYQKYIK